MLKTATDTAGMQRHAVYITGGLELRSRSWDGTDFVMDARTTSLCDLCDLSRVHDQKFGSRGLKQFATGG